MAERERVVAHFSGHVQGVGFRFTALDIARTFPEIVGFVRNLPDGRVEVLAEGPGARVEAFIGAIEAAMEPYVHNVSKVRLEATGEFSHFTVAR